ncbi:MAG: hypothetical protein ACK4V4_05235 [Sphingobacteriales bacterium]|jgi:hypothetical protein
MKIQTQTLLATLVVASLSLTTVYSQDKAADPYVAAKKDGTPTVAAIPPEDQSPNKPVNISICYEEFSVPLAMAATFQRAKLADQALYAKLTESSDKTEVKQESFVVTRTRSGQKAFSEGIAEMIYPSDYNPAQISTAVVEEDVETEKKAAPVVPDHATGLIAPAFPTNFETRNTGLTFEIEAYIRDDGNLIDLRLMPRHTTLAGETKSGQGVSEVVMPVFEKQSIDTAVTLRIDSPFLIGTMNRPPVSKVDSDSANRVWFAFVTASITK